MKLFLDTANIDDIRACAELGILDGVTTNPTLAAKEGRSFKEIVTDIAAAVEGPVSAEVVSLDTENMVKEAREVTSWAPNIVAKIPCLPAGIRAVRQLTELGIRTNVTLVFSAPQALLAAKAGASFISPFVGRLDDIGEDGMALIGQIVSIFDNYDFDTEVIVASVRHPQHLVQAALMGAHVCTVPWDVVQKLFKHPLTDLGAERFIADWQKAGLSIF